MSVISVNYSSVHYSTVQRIQVQYRRVEYNTVLSTTYPKGGSCCRVPPGVKRAGKGRGQGGIGRGQEDPTGGYCDGGINQLD